LNSENQEFLQNENNFKESFFQGTKKNFSNDHQENIEDFVLIKTKKMISLAFSTLESNPLNIEQIKYIIREDLNLPMFACLENEAHNFVAKIDESSSIINEKQEINEINEMPMIEKDVEIKDFVLTPNKPKPEFFLYESNNNISSQNINPHEPHLSVSENINNNTNSLSLNIQNFPFETKKKEDKSVKTLLTPETQLIKKIRKNNAEKLENGGNKSPSNIAKHWEIIMNGDQFQIFIPNYCPKLCQCPCPAIPVIKFSKNKFKFYQGCRNYKYGDPTVESCGLFSWVPQSIVFILIFIKL